MIDNRRIAKNTLFLYFRTFLIMLISLYTSRVVLENLGETDFGIYNLVGGIVVLFTFMNSAMSSATQRYLNYELGRGNTVETGRIFSMSLTVHFCIATAVLILGETVGLWFVMTKLNLPPERYDAAMWVYQFSLLGCCFNVLRIPYNACIIAYERMSFYAYASIIEAVLRLGIVYLLILTVIDKLIVYAVLMFAVIAAVNIIYVYYCRRYFSTSHYRFFWDKSLFARLMSFSGWSMFGSMANVGASQGISILFNMFHGVLLNAALGIANQILAAISSFVSSFQTAFSPQIVKTYAADDRENFVNLICRTSRLSYCLVFAIAPALIVCIKPILNLWLTIVPEYTTAFAVIFIIFSMIDALSGPLWISVQATGNIKRYQILMSALIISNLPIMYIMLLAGISPVYVLFIRVVINLITHFARIVYLKRNIDFPVGQYLWNVMARITAMTAISLPLCFVLVRYTGTTTGMIVVLSAVIAQNSLLSFYIGLSVTERRSVMAFIKKRISGKEKKLYQRW